MSTKTFNDIAYSAAIRSAMAYRNKGMLKTAAEWFENAALEAPEGSKLKQDCRLLANQCRSGIVTELATR